MDTVYEPLDPKTLTAHAPKELKDDILETKAINTPQRAALKRLREPFPENLINKLPKGTKAQNECLSSEKRQCPLCDGWHHPQVKHLDYVGHAALTDRLLEVDPFWTWQPMAVDEKGLPLFDSSGGLWITLRVYGVTRFGYGHAEDKKYMDPGARIKEVIGDALRNAGMRFGCALDKWHKGDLRSKEDIEEKEDIEKREVRNTDPHIVQCLLDCSTLAQLETYWGSLERAQRKLHGVEKDAAKLRILSPLVVTS